MPETTTPAVPEDVPGISKGKRRALGIDQEPFPVYLASRFPDIIKGVGNRREFDEAVERGVLALRKDIYSGKFLNTGIDTAQFERDNGYPPSAAQRRETLERFRTSQREILTGWADYLKDGGYSMPEQFLLLSSVAREVAEGTDESGWRIRKIGGTSGVLPTAQDPELAARFVEKFPSECWSGKRPSQVLAECHKAVAERTKNERGKGTVSTEWGGTLSWVKFPSRENDPDGFDRNVRELAAMARTVEDFGACKWCTAYGQAPNQLSGGDFWVGVDEDGRARIGVKMKNGHIDEISGVLTGQAMEPKYAPYVLKLVEEQELRGGERWVDDARIKGRVAEMEKPGDWGEFKSAIGIEDDREALTFVRNYRGPRGSSDYLVGAGNGELQKTLWEKLKHTGHSPLHQAVRSGAFPQTKAWFSPEMLDYTPEGGKESFLHFIAGQRGSGGRIALAAVKGWGHLTHERQGRPDRNGDNFLHVAAANGHLAELIDWEGVNRGALFAHNDHMTTPMHAHLQGPCWTPYERDDGTTVSRAEAIAGVLDRENIFTKDGRGRTLVHVFAQQGELSSFVESGLVRKEDLLTSTDGDGNTPLHVLGGRFDVLRTLAQKGIVGPPDLLCRNAEGRTAASELCRRGYFHILHDANLLTPEVLGARNTDGSHLGHLAFETGTIAPVLRSGLYSHDQLFTPDEEGRTPLHRANPHWNPDLDKCAREGLMTAGDFSAKDNALDTPLHRFAEKGGALLGLSKAGLATKEGLGARNAKGDNPLNLLPPHSSEEVLELAKLGLVSAEALRNIGTDGRSPLHNFVRDDISLTGGEGVLKLLQTCGMEPADVEMTDATGRNCLYGAIVDSRTGEPVRLEPLLQSGIATTAALFHRPNVDGKPSPSLIERFNPEQFAAVRVAGLLDAAKMAEGSGEDKLGPNVAALLVSRAEYDRQWEGEVVEGIRCGAIGADALDGAAKDGRGKVRGRLLELPSTEAFKEAVRMGLLTPENLVEGDGGKPSLLASAMGRCDDSLRTLLSSDLISREMVGATSCDQWADRGNPARTILEKSPEIFEEMAGAGLFETRDIVFGRGGFDSPLKYALKSGKLELLGRCGFVTREALTDGDGPSRVWFHAREAGCVGELVEAFRKGGVGDAELRDSLTGVQSGRTESVLEGLSSYGGGALLPLIKAGLITRGDIVAVPEGEKESPVLRNLLSAHPEQIGALTEIGILKAGDAYPRGDAGWSPMSSLFSNHFGKESNASSAKHLVESGIFSREDGARLADDLSRLSKSDGALAVFADAGVISQADLLARRAGRGSALDGIIERAGPGNPDDLRALIERGMVPEEHLARARRALEGHSSPTTDILENVTSKIKGLLGAKNARTENSKPLAAAGGAIGSAGSRKLGGEAL